MRTETRSKVKKFRRRSVAVAVVALLTAVATVVPAGAKANGPKSADTGYAPGTVLKPTVILETGDPMINGALEAESVEGFFGDLPADATLELTPGDIPPFRTTMDQAEYQALKETGRVHLGGRVKPTRETPALNGPPGQIGSGKNFSGVNSTVSGNLRPPDTHGAMGNNHFVQIVNSRTAAYKKQGPGKIIQFQRSLASHFNYVAQTIFDPRVVYDPVWDRWVWIAEAFPESATVQKLFVAVSRTPRPQGSYCLYHIDINYNNNDDFFDYPQLGYTQDALLITGNIFGPEGYRTTRMMALAKAGLYNCRPIFTPIYSGLDGTLAPPISTEWDVQPSAFFAAATPANNHIDLWRGDNLENASYGTMTKLPNVAVPAYTVPPNAPQVGTSDTLDTSDSRFVNASTQKGTSLYNVHTVATFGGAFAGPRFYEINTSNSTLKQSDDFWISGSSFDFNASVAASDAGYVYFTWSATDATRNAMVAFGGREPGDPLNTVYESGAVKVSTTFYNPSGDTVERWGDYSSTTIDPSPPAACTGRRAWITNEWIETNSVWGSWISRIGHC